MRMVMIGAVALMVAACASIGRPQGGPRDEKPPVYVRSNPEPGALNVDRNRIELWFDENLQLDDPSNKIVVSPVQKENARVTANGHRIVVELRDTLQDSTTYTIDFADAIRDLNEQNILDGFAFDFSTGPTLDTLTISGMVFEARNLEPAQGMIVGVYSNLSDTSLTTQKLERVAKTNQLGQFTIRGLHPGVYNIFAIDDRNHDWHWDRSENVAFYPLTISPSVTAIEVTDTLRASDGTDSLVTRAAWQYLPDDILLTWFNEDYRAQYLRDNKRTSQRTIELKFAAPVDSMPTVTLANGPFAGRLLEELSVLETRPDRDSLVYWIRDTTLLRQDSILLSVRYQKTDTLDALTWQTDTLRMFYRAPKENQKEKKAKKKENADSLATDSLPEIDFLTLRVPSGSDQHLNMPVRIEADQPLLPVPDNVWRLEYQKDTLWLPVADATLRPDSATARGLILNIPRWMESTRYRFTADSTGISNIYGEFNRPFTHEFTTKSPEDYGTIYLNLTDISALGLPDSANVIVELLKSDKPVAAARLVRGTATFRYMTPDTYYARAYIDLNGDSLWTTGNIALQRLPEDVFYYPKKLLLRKNWDLEQDWGLLDTPVDLQKPDDIKTNKPKNSGKDRNTSTEEEDEYSDEYDPMTGTLGGSRYDSFGNRPGSSTGSSGFSGGRPGMATQSRY